MNKFIYGLMIGLPFLMMAWVYQNIPMTAVASAHFALWPSLALAVASCMMANANKTFPNIVLIIGSIGTSFWMAAIIGTSQESVIFGHYAGVCLVALHYMFMCHMSGERFHVFHFDKIKNLTSKKK